MSNPRFVKDGPFIFEINTDFRVAIKCNGIAKNSNISDIEKVLAINYLLFGKRGLEYENQKKLFELGIKYISFNQDQKSLKNEPHEKHRLDFEKCEGLIKSSFKFDYGYDPYEKKYIHWYDFYNDLENLSSNEFGTCCILNRVNNLLSTDLSKIKDVKERERIKEAQEQIIEKYCYEEVTMTKEQEKNAEELYKQLGII